MVGLGVSPNQFLVMRIFLQLVAILLIGNFQIEVFANQHKDYNKCDAIQFVLDDYCKNDCSGYKDTHSPRYRQVFIQALNGENIALRQVFFDPKFHSGDNETWEAVPGNILFVIGDRCFADFMLELNHEEQRWALMKIPIAAPFHDADIAGKTHYFKEHFPRTYKFYALHFPEFSHDY